MFVIVTFFAGLLLVSAGCTGTTDKKEKEYSQAILEKQDLFADIYEIGYTSIDGKRKSLGDYRGKVIMIVNTASECGYTSQLAELENIYKRYKYRGFVIIGFPCNQFFRQEPRQPIVRYKVFVRSTTG